MDNRLLWEKLQANGLKAYTLAPEASCSICGRGDVEAWRKFLRLRKGMKVLDVGCGCIGTPAYLKGWKGVDLYGIDPLCLPSAMWDGMRFVKGIAEQLPFPDHVFDVILFTASLDHIADQERAIQEARRCLNVHGVLKIRLGIPPVYSLADKAFAAIKYYGWYKYHPKVEEEKPNWVKVNETMTVPEGALDLFHFRRDNRDDVVLMLEKQGFSVIRERLFKAANLFVEAKL